MKNQYITNTDYLQIAKLIEAEITLVKILRSVRNKTLKCRLCFRTFHSSNYIFTTLLFMFATLWTTTRNATFARIRRPRDPYSKLML